MSDTEGIQKVAARIMRANAKKVFTTKCTACGKNQTQSLHWLQTKRFVCPSCGGRLDDYPLHQLTRSVMSELRSSAKTPKTSAVARIKAASAAERQFGAAKGYQLVLQFRCDALGEFDAMVALEDELIGQLGDSADVDGHDVGSGECNIFIFTSDPVATFDRARAVLERRQQLKTVTAAYREVEGENYTLIWPEDSPAEFRLL